MKKVRKNLTAKFVRSILAYDSKTGIFRWRYRKDRHVNWNSRWVGKVAGSEIKGHITIQVKGRGTSYYAQRLAWLHHYGHWPRHEIDHRDGVRSHNWIKNLREADDSQNACNKAMQSNNTSGFVGVTFHPATGKWRAAINVREKKYSLGLHKTPELAAKARNKAALALHGEFAKT